MVLTKIREFLAWVKICILNLLTKCRRYDMKFEYFKDRRGEWRFNGVARNHKVVCSSEGYKTKRGMMNGIDCIMKGSAKAAIVARK